MKDRGVVRQQYGDCGGVSLLTAWCRERARQLAAAAHGLCSPRFFQPLLISHCLALP